MNAPNTTKKIIGPGFRDQIYTLVKKVPRGSVTTYGDLGGALGSRRIARQVGFALAACKAENEVPWHRVINSQGCISARGDSERALQQEAMLVDEGHSFSTSGKIKDFTTIRHAFPAPKELL